MYVPKIFGYKSEKSKTSVRRAWNDESFFDEVKNKFDAATVDIMRNIYEFSVENAGRIIWGTGMKYGSFSSGFDKTNGKTIYGVYTDGSISVNFGNFSEYVDEKKLGKFADTLRKVKSFNIPVDFTEKYPGGKLQEFSKEDGELFKKAVLELIEE